MAKQAQDIVAFLTDTMVFNTCPPEYLAKLAPLVQFATFAPSQTMVAAGAMVTSLNFLCTGRASLQLVNAATGDRVHLEDVFPGDTFGEVGMVIGGANPAVVVAEEACEALLVQKAHFDKIAQAAPQVATALMKRIATRFVKASLLGSRTKGSPRSETAEKPPSRPPVGLPQGAIAFVEVGQFNPTQKVIEMIPSRLMLEHRLLPLEVRGRSLVVGMVNPSSIAAREDLRKTLHALDPEICAISQDDFAQTVVRMKLDVRDRVPAGAAGAAASRAIRPVYQAELKKDADKAMHVVGDEVVSLLDRIIVEAVERGVSDVHIEPDTTGVRVRYRIQGMLQDRKELVPASLAAPLAARVKVLAELDITERRQPQDGRIVMSIGSRELNARVSTMPIARGEKVVLRILDPSDVMRPLEHIFLDPRSLDFVARALAASHGAIVVAGATGSGKSSTQYSLLNQRKKLRPDNAVVTVEDPIEFLISGITQAPVSAKGGMEYASALRGLMRQDPDVIMIGELRDQETAAVLVEAALTGHLLLATMHGSNVNAVFQRFEHFGTEGHLLGQALNIIIVQKLARKLCSACVREEEISPQLVETLAARKLMTRPQGGRFPRPGGCEACGMTGYRGRVAVHELFAVEGEIKDALTAGAPLTQVLPRAEELGNYIPITASAKLLMARKAITPADAISVVT